VARSIPADRFAAVVDAAADVFITHGYQRAQIQDVADALGLGKGTLYGYADGKLALFAIAVRYADRHEPLPGPAHLPVPVPIDGEVAGIVAARLGAEVAELTLIQALSTPAPERVEEELAGIVTDLYQRLARHRVAIKLVDRCAPELPDLAHVWFGEGRGAHVAAMAEYLTRRAAIGALRLPGPADLVARTIVETCALWAVHSHFDPAPKPHRAGVAAIDDALVTATLARLFTRATTPGTTRAKAT
jgi:AcrR family transcriptional regulator